MSTDSAHEDEIKTVGGSVAPAEEVVTKKRVKSPSEPKKESSSAENKRLKKDLELERGTVKELMVVHKTDRETFFSMLAEQREFFYNELTALHTMAAENRERDHRVCAQVQEAAVSVLKDFCKVTEAAKKEEQ